MRTPRSNTRRANTLVLAVGILVLLAIVATSYVVTTHSSRVTATSQQYASIRNDAVRLLADTLAEEIAGSLFVRPVAPANPLDSSFPRAPTPREAPRYLGDQTDVLDNTTGLPSPGPTGPGDGVPDYQFNVPPYITVPWTNWPDPDPLSNSDPWPINEDNPGAFPLFGGVSLFPFAGEGNPPGGPGFGDSRWLADTEPLRLAIGPGPDNFMGSADDVVIFTHWRHMSNLARPNNGLRACYDASNVFLDNDGDGVYEFANVVTDLAIPHEQWLAVLPQPAMHSALTGEAVFDMADNSGDGHADPLNLWWNWLSWDNAAQTGYPWAYANPPDIPINFYNLRDLDGDGVLHEPGERPMDEFVGPGPQWPRGTPRWNVGRMLADADGDGFTDSMWFLVPAGVDRSIRQVVAVRIVDNSAMLNVNLATRFVPRNVVDASGNWPVDAIAYRTTGLTPADLAQVGSLERYDQPLDLPDWPGFFDNPDHWFQAPIMGGTPLFNALYDDFVPGGGPVDPESLWERHLREMGLLLWTSTRSDLVSADQGDDLFLDELARHDYWLGIGQAMLASESRYPLIGRNYTPYGIPEELELRMFHGNNNPWTYSRLERVTQPSSQDTDNGILHAGPGPGTSGSSEFLGRLANADLVRDSRRKVTTYSGARNDVMPPWLWRWRTLRGWDFDDSGLPLDGDERRQYAGDVRKYDLRRSFLLPDNTLDQDADGDGVVELPGGPYHPALDDDLDDDGFVDINDHHALLQRRLERVLMDVQARNPLNGDPTRIESYFGNTIWGDVKKSTRAAASLAANILAYRDADAEPLAAPDAVIWADPQVPYAAAQKNGYIGLEAQPFLVEALIAHVYRYELEAEYDHVTFGDPPIQKGDKIVCQDSPQSTIVVVKVANPFDVPVPMGAFALRVFGAEMPFNNAAVPGLSAPLLPGHARCFYAMEDGEAVSVSKWLTVLGLVPTPTVEVFDVTGATGAWKTSRGTYDSSAGNDAAELVRYIDNGAGLFTEPVVVDRIDIRPGLQGEPPGVRFGDEVAEADTSMPPPSGSCIEPAPVPPDTVADVWPDVWNLCRADPVLGQPRICDTHLVYMSWACRPWQIDLDGNGTIEDDERNPRFVFANRFVQRLARGQFNENDSVDQWFIDDATGSPPFDVPPAFNALVKAGINDEDDPTNPGQTFRDELDFPMQMLQKDGDFEQAGEIYNLWLFGHELEYGQGAVPAYQQKTLSTFSEFLWEELDALASSADASRVNRLRITPEAGVNPLLGRPLAAWNNPQPELYLLDPAHGTPRLTAGARALEAFVCDGPGAVPWPDDVDGDGQSDGVDAELRSLRLAGGFAGRGTPGLININTATPEVLRALPGWFRLVHEMASSGPNPYVHIGEAAVRYRERLGDPTVVHDAATPALYDTLPSYGDRGFDPQPPRVDDGFFPGLRQSRGFASIGELGFLLRAGKWGKDDSAAAAKYDPSQNPGLANILFNSSFGVNYPSVPERDVFEAEMGTVPPGAYLFPDASGNAGTTARVSTDVIHGFDPGPTPLPGDDLNVPDATAADSEENNLLLAGASNLVTTRSDVFTVYFKVRSFRQNPVTGRWDATDPEMIVDDSRYVMLVDRTQVNTPGDRPRIVYLEKLPP
jgi:hypothetical protein